VSATGRVQRPRGRAAGGACNCPPPAQPTYGYINFFLNTDRKLLPSAPATSQAGHLFVGTADATRFVPVPLERPFPAAAVLAGAPGRALVAGPRGVQSQPLP